MNYYHEPVRLVEPVGNNAIAYDDRMALGSQWKLFIPQLVTWTLDDLALWDEIVFEEVENGKLISCKGLQSLLKIVHNWKAIYITDNHNHALYFRYDALHNGLIQPGAMLLHIDQHADFNEPNFYLNWESKELRAEWNTEKIFNREEMRKRENEEALTSDQWLAASDDYDLWVIAEYVNTQTQIASFIKPALHSGLIGDCIQIRSEAKLQEIIHNNIIENWALRIGNSIVDIDIDFFAHETDVTHKMSLLRQLLSSASVATIATSPYFIDQQRAIELVRELLQESEK